ncbi:MAG: hypothetical protein Q4D06_03845 [Coriobacteriia bacterium]|nr:hypothetical protein [Coriobacteriia bacterium]
MKSIPVTPPGPTLYEWAVANLDTTELRCKKGTVNVISCGSRTYTWFVKEGCMFTTMQTEQGIGELANSIWQAGNMIHSLEDDKMLPMHALTDVVLVRVSSEDFNEQVHKDASLSWELAEYYHYQFVRTLDNYKRAALDPSEVRLQDIEEYLQNIDALKGERVSDSTLASFMGMHRVSISRIRKKLSQMKEQS